MFNNHKKTPNKGADFPEEFPSEEFPSIATDEENRVSRPLAAKDKELTNATEVYDTNARSAVAKGRPEEFPDEEMPSNISSRLPDTDKQLPPRREPQPDMDINTTHAQNQGITNIPGAFQVPGNNARDEEVPSSPRNTRSVRTIIDDEESNADAESSSIIEAQAVEVPSIAPFVQAQDVRDIDHDERRLSKRIFRLVVFAVVLLTLFVIAVGVWIAIVSTRPSSNPFQPTTSPTSQDSTSTTNPVQPSSAPTSVSPTPMPSMAITCEFIGKPYLPSCQSVLQVTSAVGSSIPTEVVNAET